MDVRAQMSMVFHLDKLHRVSHLLDRLQEHLDGPQGYGLHVVEQRRDQARHGLSDGVGGPGRSITAAGVCENGDLRLRSTSKTQTVFNIFHNPHQPSMDDYYEPWTYDYQHLFNAPEGPDQPTAVPISMVTGDPIQIKAGPNWDDDLGGSPVYGENDPNLAQLNPDQRAQMFAVERLMFFYLPRICNHCLNPGCVAACPSARAAQTRRGRHCAGGSEALPGLEGMHRRMPVQEDVLQLANGQVREMHSLLRRAWRPGRRPRASTLASDGSVIWESCCTMPNGSAKWRACRRMS